MIFLTIGYIVVGILTAGMLYSPAGRVHFEETTLAEFICMVGMWPCIWLFGFLLVAAALLENLLGWTRL